MKSDKGLGILELLVSLTLGLLISVSALSLLKSTIKTEQTLKLQKEIHYKNFRLKSLIKEILNKYDQHGFSELKPLILNSNEINTNLALNINKLAKNNSTGIYYPTIKWFNFAKVTKHENNLITACHKTPVSITKESNTFLGLTLKGFIYLKGSSELVDKNCRNYYLAPADNFYQFPKIQISNLLIIFPLETENLVYLDKENRLRLLTLEGFTIKENSTLLEDMKKMLFNLDLENNTLSYLAKHLNSKKEYSGESQNLIIHDSYQNFLLNFL